jgi:hypothetical protein
VLAHFGAERADCMELTTRVQIACQALWKPTHIARVSGVAVMIGVLTRNIKAKSWAVWRNAGQEDIFFFWLDRT